MTEEASAAAPDIREQMVQATIQLLAEDGPEALQVRRIAAAVGVSSMLVYSRFGGLPQLVEAVISAGFQRISECFALLRPTDDPIADMTRLALSYYEFGQQNPHLFDLMFGLSTPGGYRQLARPSRTPGVQTGSSLDDFYAPVIQHVERAINSKRIRPQDPDRIAAQIWSFVHGFTALELGGYYSQFADPIVDVFEPLTTQTAVGLGDTQRRAARSAAAAIADFRP